MSTNKSISIKCLTVHAVTEVANEVVCTIRTGLEYADFVVSKAQLATIIKLLKMDVPVAKLIKYIDTNITPILLMAV